MKSKIILGLFVMMLGIALTGCGMTLGSFTVISTKNIDWSRASEFTRYNQRVTGEDLYTIIIIIPTKMNATIGEAVDKAIQQIPGGIALIDAVLKNKFFYIPYIYGEGGFIVEGNVLIDPQLVSTNSLSESKYLLFYTIDGSKFVIKELTKEDYKKYL